MQRSRKNDTKKETPRVGTSNKVAQSGRKTLTRQQKAMGVKKVNPNKVSKNSFSSFIDTELKESGRKYLSGFSYKEAYTIVNQSIKNFWAEHKVPGKCLKLVESQPHHGWRGDCALQVSGRGAQIKYDIPREFIKLDQVDDLTQDLFDLIINQVSKPHLVSLQNTLSAILIRTLSNDKKAVIFQVTDTTKRTIQNLKSIDGFLKREREFFDCSYALITPSRNAYNFIKPLPLGHGFKKISGPDTIAVGPDAIEIHPLDFYRPNRAIVSEMSSRVIEMLNPKATENFIDLYSGSGQWTFLSGGIYNRTYSIDIKKYSREGFMVNAAKNKVRNCSFVTEKISSEFLKKFIAEEPEFKTTVMLDGPTGQLEDGILRTLAEKKVQRIIHVFDDINAVPEQIRKWRKHGYILKKIIPFDSKPFSGQVECIALLNIDFLGLLDKTKTLKKKQIKTGPKANTSGIRFVQD